MNESYNYFSSLLPIVQKFRKNSSVNFHSSRPSPLCGRPGDSFAVTINFEAIINGIRSFKGSSVSNFFCLCKKTFVRLNALIFLGKKSDYANVLNQPFRAFARAV